MASHDVTKRLEKLDARPLEGHFAMRLPGRLARDIRSRWKTSHSKVIFYDFIATAGHLLSSRGKENCSVCLSDPERRGAVRLSAGVISRGCTIAVFHVMIIL